MKTDKRKIMKTEIKKTDKNGNISYYNEKDQLHRDGGLPAIEDADGDKAWYVNDQLHRDGGLPAIERANGYKEWWVNGKEMSEADAKQLFAKPKQKTTTTDEIDALRLLAKHFGFRLVQNKK